MGAIPQLLVAALNAPIGTAAIVDGLLERIKAMDDRITGAVPIWPQNSENGYTSFTIGTNGTFSAWTEVDASLAAETIAIIFSGSIGLSSATGGQHFKVEFGLGAAGAEVAKTTVRTLNTAHVSVGAKTMFTAIMFLKIAAGTRLAVRATNETDGGAGTCAFGWSAYQV